MQSVLYPVGSRGCYDYKNLNPYYEMRADRDMTARAVEQLVDEVDALGLDLTATYDSWLRVGLRLRARWEKTAEVCFIG